MQVEEKYERDMRLAKQTVQMLISVHRNSSSENLFESLEYLFESYIDAKRSLSYYKNRCRSKEEAAEHD